MQAVNVSLDTTQNLQQSTHSAQTQKSSQSFSFMDLVKAESVRSDEKTSENSSLDSNKSVKNDSVQTKSEQKVAESHSEKQPNNDEKSLKSEKAQVSDAEKIANKPEQNDGKIDDAKLKTSEKVSEKSKTTRNALLNQLLNKNQEKQDDLIQDGEGEKIVLNSESKTLDVLKSKESDGSKKSLKDVAKKADLLTENDEDVALNSELSVATNLENQNIHSDVVKKLDDKNSLDDKNTDRKKTVKIGDKASFTVTDLRTVEENSNKTLSKLENSTGKDFKTSIDYNGKNDIQLTIDLNQNQASQNILSSNNQAAGASGSNFQAMLENLIQDSAPDFARAGSIVLKDNNVGSISLVLHPEALGNVKINLELTDKVITGHITVNSKEAMAAFEGHIESLKSAFSQNGFDSASFDLSMAGQNAGGFKNDGQSDSRQMQLLSDRLYGEYTESSSVIADDASSVYAEKGSNYRIDIVA